jgi:hypothetical protein
MRMTHNWVTFRLILRVVFMIKYIDYNVLVDKIGGHFVAARITFSAAAYF